MAPRYERLRPLLATHRRRLRMILERCPLPVAPSVLEIGCGTGRLVEELGRMCGARLAAGVDLEPAMLRAGAGRLAAGTADSLPLRDGAFDLAFMSLVFHLLDDRAQAARELRRVVRPGGSAAIWTLTPEHVEGFHLNRCFPSLPAVDLPRFEAPEGWLQLLLDAGFESAAEQELVTLRRTTARKLAAAVRGRYISTLALLPREEFEAGAAELEAEARADPGRTVTYRQVWCLLWAR